MPYFCGAFARTDTGWIGTETDLSEAAGLDDVADIMREAAVETAGDTVVLLVERQADDWFAVVRLDDGGDPRVFLSDAAARLHGDLAALLCERFGDMDETPAGRPAGDPELLTDLGVAPAGLTALVARSSPADALATIAERAGFAEEYERLR